MFLSRESFICQNNILGRVLDPKYNKLNKHNQNHIKTTMFGVTLSFEIISFVTKPLKPQPHP